MDRGEEEGESFLIYFLTKITTIPQLNYSLSCSPTLQNAVQKRTKRLWRSAQTFRMEREIKF